MKIELIPLEGDTPGHAFTLRVVRFGQAGAGPDIYMQAGLHANEVPGMLALDRLIPMLDAAEREGRLEGRVTLVPNANPVGLSQSLFDRAFGVHELNSGMNFNRVFPAEAPSDLAGRSVAQRLKATLIELAVKADVVLDLHCDEEAPVYLFAPESCLPDARDLAWALGAVVILTEPGQGPESFDMTVMQRWGERAGVAGFAATVELRGMLDVTDELAERNAAGLYRYLAGRGTVRDALTPLTSPEPLIADVGLAEYVATPVAGTVLYDVDVGDRVVPGQRVAQILPDAGAPRRDVTAPAAGFVLARRDRRFLRRGDDVLTIVRT
jgi:predicted deacylase